MLQMSAEWNKMLPSYVFDSSMGGIRNDNCMGSSGVYAKASDILPD